MSFETLIGAFYVFESFIKVEQEEAFWKVTKALLQLSFQVDMES